MLSFQLEDCNKRTIKKASYRFVFNTYHKYFSFTINFCNSWPEIDKCKHVYMTESLLTVSFMAYSISYHNSFNSTDACYLVKIIT